MSTAGRLPKTTRPNHQTQTARFLRLKAERNRSDSTNGSNHLSASRAHNARSSPGYDSARCPTRSNPCAPTNHHRAACADRPRDQRARDVCDVLPPTASVHLRAPTCRTSSENIQLLSELYTRDVLAAGEIPCRCRDFLLPSKVQ